MTIDRSVARRREGARAAMVAALLSALLFAPGSGAAVPPGSEIMPESGAPAQSSDTGDAAGAPVQELPLLDGIMASLAALRGLEFKKPVPGRKQSAEEWGEVVQRELDTMFPPERREGILQGLVRLGMLAEAVDVTAEFKNALVTQAAGYYDPETDTFYYLVSGVPKEFLETIASHELVHALQDQHFDLTKLVEPIEALAAGAGDEPRNDDGMHALRFLIEGEATYVQMIWQMKAMAGQLGGDLGAMGLTAEGAVDMAMQMMGEMDVEQMRAMAEMQREQLAMLGDDMDGFLGGAEIDAQLAAMDEIPPYIMEPLLAAYLRGAVFAMKLRQRGGWAAIDKAYSDLPVSTEQTLHPSKYIDERDEPTALRLPAAARELLAAEGWTQIDAAVHGEMYLDMLLRLRGIDRTESRRAAAGWDGDVYYAFRDRSGKVLVVLMTTWDGEPEAIEFFESYRSTLPFRYPDHRVRLDQPGDGGVRFDTTDPDLGHGAVVRHGREVFAVEGGSPRLVELIEAHLKGMEVDHR